MTKSRKMTSREENNYVKILRDRPNQIPVNTKTQPRLEALINAFGLFNKLEDVGLADISQFVPGVAVFGLIKQVLHLAKLYFRSSTSIQWQAERNPEVIAGEATQSGASAELVDSKRIRANSTELQPEAIAEINKLCDTLWTYLLTAEKAITGAPIEAIKLLRTSLDDVLVSASHQIPYKMKETFSFNHHSAGPEGLRNSAGNAVIFKKTAKNAYREGYGTLPTRSAGIKLAKDRYERERANKVSRYTHRIKKRQS